MHGTIFVSTFILNDLGGSINEYGRDRAIIFFTLFFNY
ncbi:hypothetical protein SHOMR2_2013 [Staphylococcus hominis]|nr:hypothetical protein SHOMR2_2013 [Staphylococcus hominis]KMU57911.1 hypothetical protein SHOMR1_0790 [Staphylococcus hominis]